MDIIPLVTIKKGTLYDGREGTAVSVEDLFTRVDKDAMLYVLDYDGVESNSPNFEVYQRLTEQCILWIDNGPRRIDDVMDTIMAGATNLTLRRELWPDLDMPGIQQMTDDEIFLDLSVQHKEQRTLQVPYAGEIGVVLFNEETAYGALSKDIVAKQKIFLYVDSMEKLPLLEQQGIAGVIIDLQRKHGA